MTITLTEVQCAILRKLRDEFPVVVDQKIGTEYVLIFKDEFDLFASELESNRCEQRVIREFGQRSAMQRMLDDEKTGG